MGKNDAKSRRPITAEESGLWTRAMRDVRPRHLGVKNTESNISHSHMTGSFKNEPVEMGNNGPMVDFSGQDSTGDRPSITDWRSLRRIKRGQTAIDARLDLHGYKLQRAHRALAAFLRNAQIRGYRCVLIITGKALRSQDPRASLRIQVPKWLLAPDMRPFVQSSATAALKHGGGGALYVMVRRRKTQAPARE